MSRPPRRKSNAESAPAEQGTERARSLSPGGTIPSHLMQIRASNADLVTVFGSTEEGKDLLVPLLDWQLFGSRATESFEPDEKGPQIYSTLLGLDNGAFLLQDLAFDMQDAVRQLCLQSKGGVAPRDDRMRYAARMLRLAAKNATAAAEQMEAELLTPEDAAADEEAEGNSN